MQNYNAKIKAIEENLNLEPVIIKAMDSEEGYGWDFDKACSIAKEYKKFLTLCLVHENEPIVPSNMVDDFWHLHILDTQKYHDDCINFLGGYLHHFPYFGMRSENDAENLTQAWDKTKILYADFFGERPSPVLWPKSNRCPNCARRNNNYATEKRPSFAEYGYKSTIN